MDENWMKKNNNKWITPIRYAMQKLKKKHKQNDIILERSRFHSFSPKTMTRRCAMYWIQLGVWYVKTTVNISQDIGRCVWCRILLIIINSWWSGFVRTVFRFDKSFELIHVLVVCMHLHLGIKIRALRETNLVDKSTDKTMVIW